MHPILFLKYGCDILGYPSTLPFTNEKGARTVSLRSYNTNPNMVEYVGRHGYHHLGLPQLSVELGVILGNI